ncbi:hypothetical protein GPALN_011460 [Globodera pallida]|uniref:Golgi apparatus membrane protein TVP23 homolog n=1 Tax=Globodera pallida TaxID=36090 RepID=A0A183CPT7_GLOPA|nr:hypothetical protein GPALN_011460 [Globodera pallida]
MAYNFEAQMDFGERRPLTGIRALKHPLVVMAHLGFRFGAIAFYVLASFFSASFIIQFLILLSLHSADLWAVKNVTGRLMVGLRWWSLVDADGKNHWKFEISQDPEKYDAFERQIFWAALVAAPFFWALLVCTAFLTLQWQWMVVATIGAGMTATNLYGYLRCKWSSTQEMTNHFTRWAFFSMLRRNFAQQQQQPSPMATQQQRQPSPRLQEIV